MLQWLTQLDRLLRGDATRPETFRDGAIQIHVRGLAVLIVLLGAIYGVCMGSYSLLKDVAPGIDDPNGRMLQLLATTIKVPALFFLTLLVTFPSLYVFNALVGSRLTIVSVLRLLIASLAVNLAVLASLGPIVMFFSLSTISYPFIQLLNVLVFSVAGVLGLMFLLQTLHRLTILQELTSAPRPRRDSSEPPADENAGSLYPADELADVKLEPVRDEGSSPLDMAPGQALGRHTRLVFGCWVVVFALVGAQMGWVLRPFIGTPNLPFEWFRERQSNFFEAVLRSLSTLLTGGG